MFNEKVFSPYEYRHRSSPLELHELMEVSVDLRGQVDHSIVQLREQWISYNYDTTPEEYQREQEMTPM